MHSEWKSDEASRESVGMDGMPEEDADARETGDPPAEELDESRVEAESES